MSEAPRLCLPIGRHRAGLPGNVNMVIGSAFLPANPAKAGQGIKPTGPRGGGPQDLCCLLGCFLGDRFSDSMTNNLITNNLITLRAG
jgi:hypothetical protein